MSVTPETLNALYHLIVQDDALLTRLQGAGTAVEVAHIIANAAAHQGISVSSDALLPHLEEVALRATSHELSSAQLEEVSAGKSQYTINVLNNRPYPGFCIFQKPPSTFPNSSLPHLMAWTSYPPVYRLD